MTVHIVTRMTVQMDLAAKGPQMAAHSALSFEVPGDKLQDQNFQV